MLTEPNLIADGCAEIVAAPGVLCWPELVLAAPVMPVQPEPDRIVKRRRARAARGIVFLPKEFVSVAYFLVPPNHFIV